MHRVAVNPGVKNFPRTGYGRLAGGGIVNMLTTVNVRHGKCARDLWRVEDSERG